MAKTPLSQCRGPRFDPWSGIPRAATKSSCATTKMWRSQINKFFFEKRIYPSSLKEKKKRKDKKKPKTLPSSLKKKKKKEKIEKRI